MSDEPTTACPDDPRLRDFLAGRMTVAEMDGLVKHFDGCQPCQQRLAELDDSEASVDSWVGHKGEIPYANETKCAEAVGNISRSKPTPTKPAALPVKPPEFLGEYELLEPLGEGGMGAVFRARHTSLESICAIKMLLPNRQADRATIERFEREMVALGKLDHPNIVRAIDAGEDKGIHFLAMEFVRGVDLSRVLRLRKQLPIAEACEVARQAALGLGYVHTHGRVHRDVKPSNLMLRSDGVVKLLDLGLAHVEEFEIDEASGSSDDLITAANFELTRSHQIMGTIEYMAPEQASDTRSVDYRADIYSLGCTLYKLLAGQSPFVSTGEVSQLSQVLAHVQTPAPPIREFREDIPAELAKVIEHMLAKAPEDRPESAEQVAAALEPFCRNADLVDMLRTPQTAKTAAHIPMATAVRPADASIEQERPFPWLAAIGGVAAVLMIMTGIGLYNLSGGFGVQEGIVHVSVDQAATEALLNQTPVMLIPAGSSDGQPIKRIGPMSLQPGTYRVSVPVDSGFEVSETSLAVRGGEGLQLLISHSGSTGFALPEPTDPSIVAEAGAPIELLPLLVPARDFESPEWALTDNMLYCPPDSASSVQFPVRPPERYRLEATIERTAGDESLCIALPTGAEPVPMILDGWPANGFVSGIYNINGRSPLGQDQSFVARGMQLPVGQPKRLVATVNAGRGQVALTVQLGSSPIFSWRGDNSLIRHCRWMPPNDRSVFMLGRFNGAGFRISDLRVVPISGEAEVVEFADPATNPQLAAAQRAVWKGGQISFAVTDPAGQTKAIASATAGSELSDIPSGVLLESIDLTGSQWIGDADLGYFTGLDTLAKLSLGETSITAAGLERVGSLPRLSELSLPTSAFSDQQSKAGSLAILESPELTTLNLASTDSGANAVEAIAKLSKLTEVDLSDTRITGEDLQQLGDLAGIRSLNLTRTLIAGDDLAQLPPLPSLEELKFNNTRIGSLDSLTAQRFPKLSRIELRGAPVTATQVNTLRDQFDGATIVSGFEPLEIASVVDVSRDTLTGTWAIDQGNLAVLSGNPARLAVPVELPDAFDLKAVLRRVSGGNAPVFGMPLPDGTRVLLGFDHWPGDGGYTILHGIDGKMERNSDQKVRMRTFTKHNQPVTLEIRVRRNGPMISIEADRNGENVIAWEGEASRLRPTLGWFGSDRRRLTISQYSGSFVFEELTISPVAGRIRSFDPAPYRNGPDRQVAEWTVANGGRVYLRNGWGAGISTWVERSEDLPARPFWIRQVRRLHGNELSAEWLAAVSDLKYLEALELSRTSFDNSDLAPLAKQSSLGRLYSWESPLDDSGLLSIARLSNLKELDISNTRITTEGTTALAGHATLSSLTAKLVDDGNAVAKAARSIPNLTYLNLGQTDISADGLGALAGHEKLAHLTLSRCPQLTLDDLDLLSELPKLQVVDIAGNQFEADACATLAKVSTLQRLRMFGNPVGDRGIELLAARNDLLELSLGMTGVSDAAMPTIGTFGQLRHLGLTGNRNVTDASIEQLAKLSSARFMYLNGTSISVSGVRQLRQALPRCRIESDFDQPANRKINLVGRGVTDETLEEAIGNLADVIELKVEGAGITDESLPLIASMPQLKRIDFERTSVTNDGVAALATSPTLEQVEFWYMPQITGDVTEHLARIANLRSFTFKTTNVFGPGLERLHGKDIAGIQIGHGKLDGAMLKEYIVPFGRLGNLDLAGAAISDADVAELVPLGIRNSLHLGYNRRIKGPGLAAVADMPGLRSLMLDASGIDDAGLTHLMAATQLERLTLRKTEVTDAAIDTIAALENLTTVDLTDTKFTAEGVAELAKRLPAATIIADHLTRMAAVYPPKNSEKLNSKGWKPSFAPDGKRVVYGLPAGAGMEIIDLETGKKQLIDIRGKDPSWSPRGDLIAFGHEPFHHSGKVEVWVVKPDGSDARRVSERATYPFWTQNGEQLVYFSLNSKGLASVAIDDETFDPQPYAPGLPSYYADATSDDKFLAYCSHGTLTVIERESGQSMFTHDFGGEKEGTGLVAFSPDGKYLAYAPFVGTKQGIWLFDWRTGAHVQWNEGEYGAPAWSPDGTRIAFDYRRSGPADQMQLWLGTIDKVLPLAEP